MTRRALIRSAGSWVVAGAPATNIPPVAGFTAVQGTGNTWAFDGASSSVDPDGIIVSWAWTFGDGATASKSQASHTYASAGPWTVTLTVTDNQGATSSTSSTVTAAAAFAIGVVKPSATNTGAGMIRSYPTGAGGTLNGTQTITGTTVLQGKTINGNVVMGGNAQLLDCIVNGVVSMQAGAGSPLIENNVIWGDGVSTTSAHSYIVNTSGASGQVRVRFNTLRWRVNTTQVGGVGSRNVLAEYNDISRVVDCFDIDGGTMNPTTGDSNTIIRGNYCHEMLFYCPANDTAHKPSGKGVLISGTSLVYNGPWTEVLDDAQATAAGLTSGAGTYYQPMNHNDIVQMTGGAKNVLIQGNTMQANWARDITSGALPFYTPDVGTGTTVTYIQLSVLMLNGCVGLKVYDNWCDYGQYNFNLATTVSTQSGDFRRNKFGRSMAPYGLSSHVPYTIVSNGGAQWQTHRGTSDANVYEDDGTEIAVQGAVVN